MTINFDGKTVELDINQMYAVYHAYMKEEALQALMGCTLIKDYSEFPEHYTDDDKAALAEMIADLMENETLEEAFDYYVSTCIAKYDERFSG